MNVFIFKDQTKKLCSPVSSVETAERNNPHYRKYGCVCGRYAPAVTRGLSKPAAGLLRALLHSVRCTQVYACFSLVVLIVCTCNTILQPYTTLSPPRLGHSLLFVCVCAIGRCVVCVITVLSYMLVQILFLCIHVRWNLLGNLNAQAQINHTSLSLMHAHKHKHAHFSTLTGTLH